MLSLHAQTNVQEKHWAHTQFQVVSFIMANCLYLARRTADVECLLAALLEMMLQLRLVKDFNTPPVRQQALMSMLLMMQTSDAQQLTTNLSSPNEKFM